MSEAVKRYDLQAFPNYTGMKQTPSGRYVLAADHDRIVSSLSEAGRKMQAERDQLVWQCKELEAALHSKEEFYQDALHSHVSLAKQRDQLAERCRELEEEARAPLCFCGLPMAKNPHPDAGKPGQLLEVGAVYVCIPCLSKANHGHAKSANALRAEVERLTGCLQKANEQAEHFEREWYLRGDEVERLRIALSHAGAWIEAAPHGENCFVSSHYDGDPGSRCNCGKDSAQEAIESAMEASR